MPFKEKKLDRLGSDPKSRFVRVSIRFDQEDQAGSWPEVQPPDASRIMGIWVPFNPDSKFGPTNPVGKCIYCGTKTYAEGEVRSLGGEHIVPQGLGGRLELREASCSKHEGQTSAIEGSVTRRHLLAVRRRLRLRSKKQSKRKDAQVPVSYISLANGEEVTIAPGLEEHPTVLALPRLHPPGIIFPRPGFGGIFVRPLVSIDKLAEVNFGPFVAASIDMLRFCQMLAKIAHGFACTFVGLDLFTPYLAPCVTMQPSQMRSMEQQCYRYVGGHYQLFALSSNLHEVGIAFMRHETKDLLIVSIRLFANMGGPIYMVVAGEIAEGATIADAIRTVHSRKTAIVKD